MDYFMFNRRPKLAVFDLFGTLVQPGVMHHPYRQLIKFGRENCRSVQKTDLRKILTIDASIEELADLLEINAPPSLIRKLQNLIDDEIQSSKLFTDVLPFLDQLVAHNIPFAICSNLAAPYGRAADLLIPGFKYSRFFSYEVGFMKPESEIYQLIVDQIQCNASDCIFVGDSHDVDFLAPMKHGFDSYHLVRGGQRNQKQVISLLDFADMNKMGLHDGQ